MTRPPGNGSFTTLSVIIPNYNYEAYVGQAIDSALALDWPSVEVIVVDDGSTDGSRRVIDGYGDRIRKIYQSNAGQLVACNKGLALARGDAVMFLDSDDVVDPSLAREVAAVWTPAMSKVQVQMRTIDAQGRATGSLFPQFQSVPTPEQVRRWSTATTAYPTPPGSANVYPRWFVDRIFPLTETAGKANDTYCLAAAPFLGDVITIAKPLVGYRIHGKNQGALMSLDVQQFERQMTRARQRLGYATAMAASAGLVVSPRALERNLNYLCYRVASLKLAPSKHPIEGDNAFKVMADFVLAFFAPQGLALKSRVSMLGWGWAVALLPASLASHLVLWRFAPSARPPGLKRFLTRLGVVKAAG